MCGYRRTTFPTSSVIRYVIFALHYHARTKREKCRVVDMSGRREPITHRQPAATSPASPATGREKLTVQTRCVSYALFLNRLKKVFCACSREMLRKWDHDLSQLHNPSRSQLHFVTPQTVEDRSLSPESGFW